MPISINSDSRVFLPLGWGLGISIVLLSAAMAFQTIMHPNQALSISASQKDGVEIRIGPDAKTVLDSSLRSPEAAKPDSSDRKKKALNKQTARRSSRSSKQKRERSSADYPPCPRPLPADTAG